MRHLNIPKSRDIQDITEYFAFHGAPIVPSTDKLFGDGGKDTWDDIPLHPSIDVSEPIVRFDDMVNFFSIILIGIFLLYAGVFIGGAIAYLLR
jgi:hypothetical protein